MLLASLAVLIAVAALAVGGLLLRRRAVRRLDWPATLSQAGMQRRGASFLSARGWQLEPMEGFAAISLYRGRKDELRMFVLFIRDHMPFDRLLRNLALLRGSRMLNIVVVYYDRPTTELRDKLAGEGVNAICYRELDRIDALCREMEQQRLAERARQMKREIAQARASAAPAIPTSGSGSTP